MTRPDHAPGAAGADPARRAPFLVLVDLPGGTLTLPAPSARAAQTVTRHLTAHYPHTRARWQAAPHLSPGPVIVFGCPRPPADRHLLDQPVHAFGLTPGQPTPSVWTALCGHHVNDTLFAALDLGMGQPCPGCHQHWTTQHHRHAPAAPSPATTDTNKTPQRRTSSTSVLLRSGASP